MRSYFFRIIIAFHLLCLASFALADDRISPALEAELDVLKDKPQLIIDTYLEQTTKASPGKSVFSPLEIYYLLNQAYYSQLMPQDALEQALNAYDLVKGEPDTWWHNNILVQLSMAYELTGQATTAVKYAERAVAWAKINKDFSLLQKGYIAKGLNELTLGKYDIALNSFSEAYYLSSQHEGTLPAGNVAYYIALAHEYSGDNKEAIRYFEEATRYYKETDKILDYSDALYGLARAYKTSGDYTRSLKLFMQSMEISLQLGDTQGQAYTYKELSGIHIHNGDVNKAHLSLIEALKNFTLSNNPYMLAEVHKQLAEFAKDQESVKQSIHLTNIALEYADGDSLKPTYIELLALKSELLALTDEYKLAFEASRTAFLEYKEYAKQNNEENFERLRAEFSLTTAEDKNRLLELANQNVNAQLEAKQQQSYFLIVVVMFLITITFLAVFAYIQSKRVQKKLASLANTDPLTKLSNRRTAFNSLAVKLRLAKRESFPLSIALVDLDFFKQINDKYGHPTGDKILVGFATLASDMFRTSDTIARIGGEEFLFIFPYTDTTQAQELIIEFTDKLRCDDSITAIIDEALTCSVGITDAAKCTSEQDAIIIADRAMYRAKNIGRDAIVIDENDDN